MIVNISGILETLQEKKVLMIFQNNEHFPVPMFEKHTRDIYKKKAARRETIIQYSVPKRNFSDKSILRISHRSAQR